MDLRSLRADYLKRLALAGRSERTTAHYARALDDFLAFCDRSGVPPTAGTSRLDRELISAYQLDLAERPSARGGRLSLASRNQHASALRGMLRHGGTVLGLDVPPPDTVVLAKIGDRGTRRMETADFDRLVEAIPADRPNSLRDRALVEVLFATGCRLSELCQLTRRRVNLKTREVEVIGKGKKARGTFLTDSALDWLRRYLESRKDDSPFLFISRQAIRHVVDPKTGERKAKKAIYPLSPQAVEALIGRLARRAQLPDGFSPHWFRHGRLTIVARHAGLLAAQELAGHASPATTRRYTKITSAELKRHFDEADRREHDRL